MSRLFGTDGVRGVANSELTPELAFRIGYAAARFLWGSARKSRQAPAVLIGMDTRRSGHMLEAALTAGVTSAGGDAHIAGILPTPGIAYLVRKYEMDAGAVISASHNPFLDNGIKFFDYNGYKMSDESEDAIEALMKDMDSAAVRRPVGGNVGLRKDETGAFDDYVAHLKSTAERGAGDLKVVLDCANGAVYKAAPAFFGGLAGRVVVCCDKPDGENINLRCGSTHMENLAKRVVEEKADMGLAFDGDGDRCLAVDERGALVDGDQILAVLAHFLKSKNALKGGAIVTTKMSNLGLLKMCAANGIALERTAVGDKYVMQRMLEKELALGGEQSGHIINLKYSTTGDGLVTASRLLAVMADTGRPLSELARVMTKYPQVLLGARVSNERKDDYLASSEITNAIRGLEERFAGRGSVLIRPSGTEPLIRVMLEGEDLGEITREAEALVGLIEDVLM